MAIIMPAKADHRADRQVELAADHQQAAPTAMIISWAADDRQFMMPSRLNMPESPAVDGEEEEDKHGAGDRAELRPRTASGWPRSASRMRSSTRPAAAVGAEVAGRSFPTSSCRSVSVRAN